MITTDSGLQYDDTHIGDGDLAAGALDGASAALGLRGPFQTGVELAESVCGMPGLGDRAAAHVNRWRSVG